MLRKFAAGAAVVHTHGSRGRHAQHGLAPGIGSRAEAPEYQLGPGGCGQRSHSLGARRNRSYSSHGNEMIGLGCEGAHSGTSARTRSTAAVVLGPPLAIAAPDD